MALLARATLATCTVALALGGCAEGGEAGAFGVELYDVEVTCDEQTGSCVDGEGHEVRPERREGRAYLSELASLNHEGVYLYLELQRQSGARGVLELDVPRHEGHGTPHLLYVEHRAGREVFRSRQVSGIIELTPRGCDCQGGRFELDLQGTNSDGDGERRRLGRGLFARGGGFCHVARTADIGPGLMLRLLSCPGARARRARPTPPAPRGHSSPGYSYDYHYPVEVGCGVEEAPPEDDFYYPDDDGGCGGEEPEDDDEGGCDAGDDSYDGYDSQGCEGDEGGGGCEDSGGGGCEGDGPDSAGCGGPNSAGCTPDAHAAVTRPERPPRRRSCSARRRPALGVTLQLILPTLLLATFVRRRRRRYFGRSAGAPPTRR